MIYQIVAGIQLIITMIQSIGVHFFGCWLQEVPQEDRRESEKGCHWTARLKMELCGGDGCHESEILAFDFQRRAWEFYEAWCKMM